MPDEKKTVTKADDDTAEKSRSEDAPAESEISRGNVFSEEGDEPEIEPAPPFPH